MNYLKLWPIISLAFLLSACGQSGPLYLPPSAHASPHHVTSTTH